MSSEADIRPEVVLFVAIDNQNQQKPDSFMSFYEDAIMRRVDFLTEKKLSKAEVDSLVEDEIELKNKGRCFIVRSTSHKHPTLLWPNQTETIRFGGVALKFRVDRIYSH